tara:strand:- start:230 stop:583 length:354 start_codon:yes stop_codon:yes gene_type:complete
MKLAYVQYIYIILALVSGISAFFNTSISIAVSGLIAPLIAWAGGSGLRGSLYGNSKQKLFGIIFGIIFLLLSSFWVNKTGYIVFLFDITLSGNLWVLIGFIVGLIFTTKKHYLNQFD